jgi:hypothetical protein
MDRAKRNLRERRLQHQMIKWFSVSVKTKMLIRVFSNQRQLRTKLGKMPRHTSKKGGHKNMGNNNK